MPLATSTQIHLPDSIRGGRSPYTGTLGEWLQEVGDTALDRLMDLMYQSLSESECDALAEQWDLDEILAALSGTDRAESVLRDLTDDPNAVVL